MRITKCPNFSVCIDREEIFSFVDGVYTTFEAAKPIYFMFDQGSSKRIYAHGFCFTKNDEVRVDGNHSTVDRIHFAHTDYCDTVFDSKAKEWKVRIMVLEYTVLGLKFEAGYTYFKIAYNPTNRARDWYLDIPKSGINEIDRESVCGCRVTFSIESQTLQ